MPNMFDRMNQQIAARQARAQEIREVDSGQVEQLPSWVYQGMTEEQRKAAANAYWEGAHDGFNGDISRNKSRLKNANYEAGRSAGRRAKYRVVNKIGKYADNEQWRERLAELQADRPVTSGDIVETELLERRLQDERERQLRRPLLEALRQDLKQSSVPPCPF